MARRRGTAATKTRAGTDDDLSYEEYSGAGARPTNRRRNVAAGAHETEPEDHDEQNRRNVGGRGGGGIQTGNYEEDYGPGARGLRNPEFQTEPDPKQRNAVLRRQTRSGELSEEFPSGAWMEKKTTARLKQVKSRKIHARNRTGRGVGVKKPSRKAARPKAAPVPRARRRAP